MEELTEKIIHILEYMNLDCIKDLRKTNYDEFKKHIFLKFEDFEYIAILKLLIDNEDVDINQLINMIKIADDIKHNKISEESAFNNFKEDMANIYIYPKFGGKESFEKKMVESGKKKGLV